MYRYVVIVLILMILRIVRTAPPRGPMRLTIDCGSDERLSSIGRLHVKPNSLRNNFDIDSFCSLIHSAIPKAVENGHFVVDDMDYDQEGFGNALVPISVKPPSSFVPKFPKIRTPRLKIPKIKVPTLGVPDRTLFAPKVGSPMVFSSAPLFREAEEEETSAERMDKFKKGVQKLLHVVKVLGKVDQYLSERTRIVIEKLSKTLAE